MMERSRAKRIVIEISSSSEQENGDDEEGGESSEESVQILESDDGFDAACTYDFDDSASSESNGDSEDEEEDESSRSEEHDDEDIQEEGEASGSERVLQLLQGGGELRKLREGLGKLALTDYKAYLRSNGLRLSGTKEECIQRIIEHWRIKDGNGQRQYPRSSFTINCTGS